MLTFVLRSPNWLKEHLILFFLYTFIFLPCNNFHPSPPFSHNCLNLFLSIFPSLLGRSLHPRPGSVASVVPLGRCPDVKKLLEEVVSFPVHCEPPPRVSCIGNGTALIHSNMSRAVETANIIRDALPTLPLRPVSTVPTVFISRIVLKRARLMPCVMIVPLGFLFDQSSWIPDS